MADQTTLNYEQIAKVRSVLSLNIYSQDSGTRTFINGNSFRVETPMTIPIDGVETAIGHVNIEGNIFYDLTVEGTRVKAKNTKARINQIYYRRVPDTYAFSDSGANYRVHTAVGDIFNKDYDPAGGDWTETVNRTFNIEDVEISSKANEQVKYVMSTFDRWQYNPTESRVTFSLTVPDQRILNVPQAPKEANVTVKYIDRATGRTIKSNDVITGQRIGSTVSRNAPKISGYTPEKSSDSVVVREGGSELIFYYNPARANVTIEYINKATGGRLGLSETRRDQIVGSTVTVNAPPIKNFAPEKAVYTHTVVEGENRITIYYIEDAKIRPWAIRKSNTWKSLNTTRQWMKIRRTANQNYWDTKSNAEIYASDVNKENFSASRIRKGGKWKAQGKIGN